jgi:hypothetical protein
MTESINYDWEAAWAKFEPPADAHPIQLNPENFDNVAGYWVTNDLLLRSALWYASIGTPVFPCCPWAGAYNNHKGEPIDEKAPLTFHGWRDATTERAQIMQMWVDFPYAMIGSPVPADELALDFDPRHGGNRWDLIDMAGIQELPITKMVLSGRYDGGHHLFYQRPLGQLTDVRIKSLGIDIRVGGKHYTILPPSVHDATGGVYLWRYRTTPPARLPDEVAKLLEPVVIQRTAVNTGNNAPTGKRLAAICRKVAATPPGNRQAIAFTWAANVLKEAGYGPGAWDAVAEAMRESGATEHDIRTALRERPDRGRVHA